MCDLLNFHVREERKKEKGRMEEKQEGKEGMRPKMRSEGYWQTFLAFSVLPFHSA